MNNVEPGKPASKAWVRVRYAETDQMGVVYHSNYLIWFEVGRVEFVRYRAPARYDDELVVETRLLAVRGAVIRFGYRIRRVADGLLLCEGETLHVCVDMEMKKRSLPAKYAERFAAHLIG
jgi:acyl-CoA thioester hydrolase